ALDHQVNLAEILFDQVDGFLLDLVGEGVAVDAFGVEPFSFGELVEGGRVVPAGGAGFVGAALALEEDADGGGAGAEGGGDARGEAVAGGGAQHQHPFRTIGQR